MNSTSLKALYTRFGPFIRFCLVGASGIVVNEAVLGLFTSVLRVNYLVSPVFATLVSSAWNFALTELWVFRAESKQSSWLRRVVPFFLLNFAALAVREPIYAGLTAGLHINYLISNLVSLGLLTVARYLVARGWIWRTGASAPQPAPAAASLD
jgi:dolichol-phosphate mannosyltransferase